MRWLTGVLAAAATLALLPDVGTAAPKEPDALVRSVADEVLRIVRQDRELSAGDPARMAELIEAKIVPHFDFERMTRLAVGRHWRQAAPEQHQALIDEFRTLLVRSYSSAYSTYNHIVVEVQPLKVQPGEEDVEVRSQIKLPGGAPPVNVNYSMVKNSEEWKVYDVSVDGVSLVTTYRTTFGEEIRRGGIDGLIKSLRDLNAAKAASSQAAGAKR